MSTPNKIYSDWINCYMEEDFSIEAPGVEEL